LDKTRQESNARLMNMYGELKMTPSEWQNGKNPQQTLSVPPVKPEKQNNNVVIDDDDKQLIEREIAQQIENTKRYHEQIARAKKQQKYIKLAGDRSLSTLKNEVRGITLQIEQKASIASNANKQFNLKYDSPLDLAVPPGLSTLQPIFNNLRNNRKLARGDTRRIHQKLQFAFGDLQGLRRVRAFKEQHLTTTDVQAASHSFSKLLAARRGYRSFSNTDALNILQIIAPDRLGDILDEISRHKLASQKRKKELENLEIRKVQLTRIVRAVKEHTAAQKISRETTKAKLSSEKKSGQGFRSRVGALLKKRSEMPKVKKAPKRKKRKTPPKKPKFHAPKTPPKRKTPKKKPVEIDSPPFFKATKAKSNDFVHRKKKKYL
jgi:hypothetical protein